MANVIKLRRGLEAARTGITPAAGEPVYTTDESRLFVGDGVTLGGVELAYAQAVHTHVVADITDFDPADYLLNTTDTFVGVLSVTGSIVATGTIAGSNLSGTNTGDNPGVTSVATGTGLTGGPITSTGTISIANTAVSAGSYGDASNSPNFTVNAQGQLTAAGSSLIDITVSQVSDFDPADYLLDTTDTFVGVLTVTGSIAVSGSITRAGNTVLDDGNFVAGTEYMDSTTAVFTGDMDTLLTPGTRRVSSPVTNAPTVDHYATLTYGNSGNVTGQIATHFTSGETYVRSYNTSFNSWKKLLTDQNFVAQTDYEDFLGNPGTDGYVLSSTIAGVRSWIAPGGGGGGDVFLANTQTFTGVNTFSAATGTKIGGLNNISPSASASGQLQILGDGYAGYIALDAVAMYIGSNSSARNLVFQTNETDRLTLSAASGAATFSSIINCQDSITATTGANVSSLQDDRLDLRGNLLIYNNTNSTILRSQDAANCALLFQTSDSVIRGYVWSDSSNNIGFRDNGGSWALRINSSLQSQFFGDAMLLGGNKLRLDGSFSGDTYIESSVANTIQFTAGGVEEARVVDSNATGATSGFQIKDHGQALRYAGFNDLKAVNVETSFTVSANDAGSIASYNTSTAYTITLPAVADLDFPVGSRIEIIQTSTGNITISTPTGVSIVWWDGTTSAPTTTTGNRIVGAGGWATLHRAGSGVWWLTGSGIS